MFSYFEDTVYIFSTAYTYNTTRVSLYKVEVIILNWFFLDWHAFEFAVHRGRVGHDDGDHRKAPAPNLDTTNGHITDEGTMRSFEQLWPSFSAKGMALAPWP